MSSQLVSIPRTTKPSFLRWVFRAAIEEKWVRLKFSEEEKEVLLGLRVLKTQRGSEGFGRRFRREIVEESATSEEIILSFSLCLKRQTGKERRR